MGYVLEFKDQPAASLFEMTPETALEFFKAKGLQPTFSYMDMIREEHDVAFTVAKMMQMDLLKTTKGAVDQAVAEGWSIGRFRRELGPKLKSAGWWGRADLTDAAGNLMPDAQLGSAHRLNTIYRSNLQSAYSVGQWERIRENADTAPWLLYDAVDDFRTRPAHARLDNTVLAASDSFWHRFMPPNGYNCRCGVIQLADSDLERMGLKPSRKPKVEMQKWRNPRTGQIEEVPTAVDPGWDHNPGTDRHGHIQKLAREKARALPKDWQDPALASLEKQGHAFFDGDEPEMQWHRAGFDTAPTALKQAVQQAKRISVQQTPRRGAYAQGGFLVEMGDYDLNSPRGRGVWRHEFGHILDVQTGRAEGTSSAGYYSSGSAWLKARDSDSKALQVAAGRGRKSKAQEKRQAERAEAYNRARDEAVQNSGTAFEPLLRKKAEAAGVDLDQFLQAMRRETLIFQSVESLEDLGAGGRNRLVQALESYGRADLEQFVHFLLYRDIDDFKTKREAYNSAEVLGPVSDLGGSTTKNKVASFNRGFPGHKDSYYRRSPSAGPTEAFANITALMGHELPFWHEVARRFTPAQTAEWEALIERLGGQTDE